MEISVTTSSWWGNYLPYLKFIYHLLKFQVSSLSSSENNYEKSNSKWSAASRSVGLPILEKPLPLLKGHPNRFILTNGKHPWKTAVLSLSHHVYALMVITCIYFSKFTMQAMCISICLLRYDSSMNLAFVQNTPCLSWLNWIALWIVWKAQRLAWMVPCLRFVLKNCDGNVI